MNIGVPKEIKQDEYRVAMTPAGVRELVGFGHRVYVQSSAGVGSSFYDEEYARAGAVILESPEELWERAELVCKVKEPVPEEYARLHRDQVLFTYLHLAASLECTNALVSSGITAIAYETVQTADGALPLLAPMSEVAGRMAPLVGGAQLQRPLGGRGVLMSGVAGVGAANVVVLGAGTAGSNAAAIAAGMHANVTVIDRDLARLRSIDQIYQGRLQTMASSEHAIEESCLTADLVIGAVLVVGARAPHLVSDALVAKMRRGSVLVDISVDQGGCFESTRPTTHSHPTYAVHESIFYCVANMPGAVPHTSTHALTNVTLPYTLAIAQHGWRRAVSDDASLAHGVNVVTGDIVSQPVAQAHGLAYRPLADVL